MFKQKIQEREIERDNKSVILEKGQKHMDTINNDIN